MHGVSDYVFSDWQRSESSRSQVNNLFISPFPAVKLRSIGLGRAQHQGAKTWFQWKSWHLRPDRLPKCFTETNGSFSFCFSWGQATPVRVSSLLACFILVCIAPEIWRWKSSDLRNDSWENGSSCRNQCQTVKLFPLEVMQSNCTDLESCSSLLQSSMDTFHAYCNAWFEIMKSSFLTVKTEVITKCEIHDFELLSIVKSIYLFHDIDFCNLI